MSKVDTFKGILQRFFTDRGMSIPEGLYATMSMADFADIVHCAVFQQEVRARYLDEHGSLAVLTPRAPRQERSHPAEFEILFQRIPNGSAVSDMTIVKHRKQTAGDDSAMQLSGLFDAHGVLDLYALANRAKSFGEIHVSTPGSDMAGLKHLAGATGDAAVDFPSLFRQPGKTRHVGELYCEAAEDGDTLPRMLKGIAPTPEEMRLHIEALARMFGIADIENMTDEEALGISLKMFTGGIKSVASVETPPGSGYKLDSVSELDMAPRMIEGKLFSFDVVGQPVRAGWDETVALETLRRMGEVWGKGIEEAEEKLARRLSLDGAYNGGMFHTGIRSRQQFANDHQAPSRGKKGRTKMFANKNGAVYPKPRGW